MNSNTRLHVGAGDMPTEAGICLLDQLVALRDEIRARAEPDLARFRPGYPDGNPTESARNLAHYLALRRFDLRSLQASLAAIGISSLGRCESHVLPTLDRIISLLSGERTDLDLNDQGLESFNTGVRRLAENTEWIFGPRKGRRQTHIMVTLPTEGAVNYDLIRDLIEAGMDCARINCAHDDPAIWEALVANVRRAGRETGRDCRIMMDLAGHKLRTGPLQSIPGVVHIRVDRDRYGRMRAPARLRLAPRSSSAAGVILVDDQEPPVLHIPDELHEILQRGDRLEFRDTRGKRRRFILMERDPEGRWVVDCHGNAYLCGDTVLHHYQACGAGEDRYTGSWQFSEFPVEKVAIRVKVGDQILLSSRPAAGRAGDDTEPAVISCTHPDVIRKISPGQHVWFDDGKIGGIVEHTDDEGILIRVTQARPAGELLRPDKGINFPGADLGLSGLSEKDLTDLDFIVAHADVVGYSFVESLADMERLMDELGRRNAAAMPIIAKIETRRAVENIPEIILGTIGRFPLGIMIARGDLAVELGGERLSEIQEEILWLCEAAHVPAVWATQVLESMTKKGIINRAEMTDAAMSGRAECVMLNKGPYVLKSVHTLANILSRIQDHQYKKFSLYRALHW